MRFLRRIAPLAPLVLFAVSSLAPASAYADGFIYIPHPPPPHPHPPRPFPRPPRPNFPLEVTRHRVKIEIDGAVAKTRVEETFHNRNDTVLEGVYIFPLPRDAAVAGFQMEMGGKIVSGEVLEADRARSIYQDIVRKMRDPGLLEYVDRGLFRASVFPIPARGDIDVVIEYTESVRRESGISLLRYPLDTGKYSAGDYQDVVIDVELESQEPIHAVNTPGFDASIDRHGEREVRIAFEAKRLAAERDFIVQWSVGEDAIAPLLLTHRGSEPEGFFFLSIAPRPERPEKAPPKDLVLAIDTSGSMTTGQKIEHVKKALRYAIDGLNPGDRFQIIDFSTEARRFRPGLVEANSENRARARDYVDQLEARGGTNIEEALRFALEADAKSGEGENAKDSKKRPRYIVLLTDGEPTIGVTRTDELLESVRKRNEEGYRLFAFGVGDDLNAKLLDALVEENRGAARYVHGDENLELALSSFHDKIDSPVLTDLAVEFRGGEVSSVYPKPLPDVFRGEQLDIFGRYKGDGFRTVVLRGNWLGEPRVFEYSLEFGNKENAEIPRLWALRAIGHLLEEMRLHGEKTELRDEVVRLSKKYGILTPYTSYLIIEDDRRLTTATPGGATRGEETLRLRHAASDSLREYNFALGGAAGADGERGAAAEPEAAGRPAGPAIESVARRSRDRYDAASGEGAVEASRELHELKAGAESSVFERSSLALAKDEGLDAVSRTIPVRHAGGKTFYFQGDRWIDSLLTTAEKDPADLPLRRIVYLSDEYFALLEEDASFAKWLSVGAQVSFVHDGKLISIVDGES